MRKAVALSLLSCGAFLCLHLGGFTAAPSSPRLLQSLRPSHPRLIMTESELERVRQMIKSEPLARAWHAKLRQQAEKMLDEPTVEYKLNGPRLLAQSRRCLDRVYTLGLLYRLDAISASLSAPSKSCSPPLLSKTGTHRTFLMSPR